MLEVLLSINPKWYNQCIEKLKEFTKWTSDIYNIPVSHLGFRFFRPDDTFSGATMDQWEYVYSNNQKEHLFTNSSVITVPPRMSIVYLGWFCNQHIGKEGYLRVWANGITKRTILSDIVFNNQHPEHYYFDMQHIQMFKENEHVDFITFNSLEFDVKAKIYPIIYLIGYKKALLDIDIGETIDYSEIDVNLDKVKSELVDNVRIKNIEKQLSLIAGQFENPIEKIKVKDTPFSDHYELRAKTVPGHLKDYLESLHNGNKICQFCGVSSKANSKYCQNCGVPLDFTEEKEKVHEILKEMK